MQQFVFTLRDDVCNANNKTEEQKQNVLKKLTEYGTVESYESVVAQERAKFQEVIDNQTKQIEAIQERELTDGEFAVVKSMRLAISGVVAKHEAVVEEYKTTVGNLENALVQLKTNVKALCGD